MRKIVSAVFHRVLEDRRLLTQTIFPYLIQKEEFSRILFVGCKWYTSAYGTLFRNKDYFTLDSDPAQRRHGAKRHITDRIENIHRHFGANELDVIICNGVFGWGLNDRAHIEKAFEGCFNSLRVGGVFILGWNDIPRRRPMHPKQSPALRLFKPYNFPPLDTAEYLTKTRNRHTYSFYCKP